MALSFKGSQFKLHIPHSSANGMNQGDLQLICRLRLRLKFMVFFQHGTADMTVQWVHSWRFSMNLGQFACSQLHSVQTLVVKCTFYCLTVCKM